MSLRSIILPSSRFPTPRELKGAMLASANSTEAVDYLVLRIKELAATSKDTSPEMRALKEEAIKAVERFAEYIHFKLDASNDPWAGRQARKLNLPDDMAQMVKTMGVVLHYAVNDTGEYKHAYAVNGKKLDKDSIADFERVFKDWLRTKGPNGYSFDEGYICDSKTKARLNANEVNELIKGQGLQEFMGEKAGINLSLNQRAFPSAAEEAQIKREVTTAMEGVSKAQAAQTGNM